MALERPTIVAAALDLLDETGLDGLTMRKLADALGVQAPSLYWHFPGKQALLDAMADALLEHVARSPVDGDDFQTILRRSADDLRNALQARRDAARVYAGTRVVGDNMLRLAQAIIGALIDNGIDPRTASRVGLSLIQYVLGFVIGEQAWQRQTGLDPAALAAQLARWDDRFPAVEAALPHLAGGDEDARFAFGVNLIIGGLARHKPDEATQVAALIQAFNASR